MIERSAPYAGLLHEVVKHNGVIYLAGVVADDKTLGMAGQARQAFDQIDQLLAAHGSSKSRLLTALIFITDMKMKPEMNRIWKEWLSPGDLPTRARRSPDSP